MTWLYVMTFGSFIGYANAFPEADRRRVRHAPTNGLITSRYIWIGAAVGALIRPVGGWLSDKLGGARVTQWDTWIMVAATIVAGYFVSLASHSDTPEKYFIPFLLTFIVLFATTGIGNGSTFRMIPIIFSKEQAGPVLGWTSAIAAYGAYLIPKIFATQIKAGTPEYALYGFAVYYASCLVVNWWFYAARTRRSSVRNAHATSHLHLRSAVRPDHGPHGFSGQRAIVPFARQPAGLRAGPADRLFPPAPRR